MLKGRLLWALLVAVLLAVALTTDSPIASRLAYGLIAVPVLGVAALALTMRRLSASVERMTAYLQVGDPVDEQVVLSSLHWWPKLLLEVSHASSPFRATGRVVSLWPYKSAGWRTRTRADRRGVYSYGIVEVVARDPFGIFERRVSVGSPQTALVYPATVDLPGFHIPAGRGWSEGMVRGKTLLPSPVVSTIREGSPNDPANRIHWPTTLRLGRLMAKEFDPEPAGPADAIWVVLDLWEGAQAGEGVESTVEYGVTIAASVARRFLETGRSVGLVAGGREHKVIRADKGAAQQGRILEALALAQPGKSGPLMRTVTEAGAHVLQNMSAVVVSPSGVQEMAAAVAFYEGRGVSAVPIALDAPTFRNEPPQSGDVYRLQGTQVTAYVIHQGDDIGRRLDRRLSTAQEQAEAQAIGAAER